MFQFPKGTSLHIKFRPYTYRDEGTSYAYVIQLERKKGEMQLNQLERMEKLDKIQWQQMKHKKWKEMEYEEAR